MRMQRFQEGAIRSRNMKDHKTFVQDDCRIWLKDLQMTLSTFSDGRCRVGLCKCIKTSATAHSPMMSHVDLLSLTCPMSFGEAPTETARSIGFSMTFCPAKLRPWGMTFERSVVLLPVVKAIWFRCILQQEAQTSSTSEGNDGDRKSTLSNLDQCKHVKIGLPNPASAASVLACNN